MNTLPWLNPVRAEALQQRLTEQQQQMQAYGEQLKREFQLLADQVLTAKASSFNLQQLASEVSGLTTYWRPEAA